MLVRVANTLKQLPAEEAEQILEFIFGELLANPFLSRFERKHLEKRREQMRALVLGERRAA